MITYSQNIQILRRKDVVYISHISKQYLLAERKEQHLKHQQLDIKPGSDLFQIDVAEDQHIESWKFNIMDLHQFEQYRISWLFFHKMNFVDQYSMNMEKFPDFIYEVKTKYNYFRNAYHNFEHGLNVVHGCYMLLKTDFGKILTDFDKLCLMFSALMHDINHTGKTNLFESNIFSDFAIQYNDLSVLEQHHVATAFMIIREDRFNIFDKMSYKDLNILREKSVKNILATDMKYHQGVVMSFQNILERRKILKGDKTTDNSQLITSLVNSELASELMIHTSDLSSPSKPWDISFIWTQRVNEEFKVQNQFEETMDEIPVTPFFRNLDNPQVQAVQEMSFLKYIVIPLWERMDKFIDGGLKEPLNNIIRNKNIWEKKAKELQSMKIIEVAEK